MTAFQRAATFLASLAPFTLAAQSITLIAPGNIPQVGDSFVVHVGDYVAPGSGGDDVTFDYTGLAATSTTTYRWEDPATAPNAAMFPDAALMLVNDGPDTLFYSAGAEGLERVGESQLFQLLGVDYQIAAAYTDGALELKLPLTYMNTWSDAISASFDVDGTPSVRSGTIAGNADSYGHVILPGASGPIEMLRVTTSVDETNVIGFVTVTHKRHITAYYPLWGKFPVLRSVSDSINSSVGFPQAVNFTEWLDTTALSIAGLNGPTALLHVWPNPANDVVAVAVDPTLRGTATLEVTDMQGRTVLRRAVNATQATEPVRINVADRAPGLYQASLITAAGTRSTCRFAVTH